MFFELSRPEAPKARRPLGPSARSARRLSIDDDDQEDILPDRTTPQAPAWDRPPSQIYPKTDCWTGSDATGLDPKPNARSLQTASSFQPTARPQRCAACSLLQRRLSRSAPLTGLTHLAPPSPHHTIQGRSIEAWRPSAGGDHRGRGGGGSARSKAPPPGFGCCPCCCSSCCCCRPSRRGIGTARRWTCGAWGVGAAGSTCRYVRRQACRW